VRLPYTPLSGHEAAALFVAAALSPAAQRFVHAQQLRTEGSLAPHVQRGRGIDDPLQKGAAGTMRRHEDYYPVFASH